MSCASVCLSVCACVSVNKLEPTVFEGGTSYWAYLLLVVSSENLLKMVEIGQGFDLWRSKFINHII